MAFNLTRRDIEDAYRYNDRALSRARDPDGGRTLHGALGRLVAGGEVAAGALGVGFVAGRFGPKATEIKIGDKITIPVDACVAIAGHALAFSGYLGGDLAEHVHNLSNGVLAGYLTKLGAGLGDKARAAAGLPSVLAGMPSAQAPIAGLGPAPFGVSIINGDPDTRQPRAGARTGGESARDYGGMPARGAGAESPYAAPPPHAHHAPPTRGPLTEAELAALASQARR